MLLEPPGAFRASNAIVDHAHETGKGLLQARRQANRRLLGTPQAVPSRRLPFWSVEVAVVPESLVDTRGSSDADRLVTFDRRGGYLLARDRTDLHSPAERRGAVAPA